VREEAGRKEEEGEGGGGLGRHPATTTMASSFMACPLIEPVEEGQGMLCKRHAFSVLISTIWLCLCLSPISCLGGDAVCISPCNMASTHNTTISSASSTYLTFAAASIIPIKLPLHGNAA